MSPLGDPLPPSPGGDVICEWPLTYQVEKYTYISQTQGFQFSCPRKGFIIYYYCLNGKIHIRECHFLYSDSKILLIRFSVFKPLFSTLKAAAGLRLPQL